MILIFFITGLIIGSFLNVVIHRLHLAESILGRSYCPQCQKKINWYDNIPLLSFIFLRARCRNCNQPISWRYPLTELFTGATFALTAFAFLGTDVKSFYQVGFLLIIFSLLLVLFFYDLKFMEVPMIIFWLALIATVVFKLIFDIDLLTNNIVGAITAMTFFWLLVFISKEKWMGWGDVYVGFLVGLLLGWPNVLVGLFLSFFIGAICAIIIMSFSDKTMKSQIPFVPFLVIGTIMTIFIAEIFPNVIEMFIV